MTTLAQHYLGPVPVDQPQPPLERDAYGAVRVGGKPVHAIEVLADAGYSEPVIAARFDLTVDQVRAALAWARRPRAAPVSRTNP
jgi:hypothetical protein